MITLSLPEGLLVIYLILIPVYIGIAGWSFRFYSLRANSSSKDIDDFQRHLYFPANLIFRENSGVLVRILGKGFIGSDINTARSQRIWILIVFGLFHIPIFIGMLSKNDLFDALCCAIFLFASIVTIIICVRFGHSLLNKSSSR